MYINGTVQSTLRTLTKVMMLTYIGITKIGMLQDYNQFTFINHTIDSSYQIYALDDQIGDVVKINNVGTGGWLLLRKISNADTQDYYISYQTIGRENGTIEFKNSLYDVNASNTAFDGASFDKIFYDTEPNTEFRKILKILKSDIFVDNLAIYWNELFFASLRYVFQNNQMLTGYLKLVL